MCEEEQIRKIMLGIEDPTDDTNSLALKDGEVVGAWRIRALVGSGGFGNVYRVEHMRSGVIAALKMLTKFDEESRKRFELETEILQAIHASKKNARRYFPAYLGTGNHQIGSRTVPYVVTEFLEPLKLPDKDEKIGKFIEQMCDAVEELHRNGYLHRDIKILNVMARKDDDAASVPILIDFGGAIRIKDAENPDVRTRVSMEYGQLKGFGTIYSSAPEQLHGIATARSDVYAFGALINECFKGSPPESWQKIVQRATAPNPDNRYASVAEMRRAISRREKHGNWFYFARIACIIGFISSVVTLTIRFYQGFLKREATPSESVVVVPMSTTTEVVTAPVEVSSVPVKGVTNVEENITPSVHDPKTEAKKAFDEYRYADCFNWARKANVEDKEIQYYLGMCYIEGLNGSGCDPVLAEKWLLKSAKQDYGPACSELGYLYVFKMTSDENKVKGFQWYKRSAELNCPMGVYYLGVAYRCGIGTEINLCEAYKNFKRAAEELYAEYAYCDLGDCYQYGWGVDLNRELAKSWYEKSMNAGYATGAANLARIYLEDREYRKVMECHRKIMELWQGRE